MRRPPASPILLNIHPILLAFKWVSRLNSPSGRENKKNSITRQKQWSLPAETVLYC
jgi:hypothetical protein